VAELPTTVEGSSSIDLRRAVGDTTHVGLGLMVRVALGDGEWEQGEEPGAVRLTQVGAIARLAPSVAQSRVASPAPLLANVNESKWHRVNFTDPLLFPPTK
jgi:hypothetical protein